MKFSIVITSYNRLTLLKRALASALTQRYDHDYEVLVIDDCSSENYEDYIASLQCSKLRYFRHNYNQGVSAARNTGVRLSLGQYVAFLDDDDQLHPEYLAEYEKHLLKYPELDFMWCGKRNQLYEDGKLYKTEEFVYEIPENIEMYDVPMLHYWSNNLGLMIKKELLVQLKGYDTELEIAEDIDLLLRMLFLKAKYRPVSKILIDVYIDTSVSSLSRQSSALKAATSYKLILEKNTAFLKHNFTAWRHYAKSLLFAYYRSNNKISARNLFWQMLCRSNFSAIKLLPRVLRYEFKKSSKQL
ncbi:glycosyltransferase family 2 protein [Cysteiniphilum sp. 6C5]|uniref:glycosyltransferase family 2 protein n=1 Tax=unclassified Cysteiniphilum TaxID=2610889 RepID=UPI003F82A337